MGFIACEALRRYVVWWVCGEVERDHGKHDAERQPRSGLSSEWAAVFVKRVAIS